MSKRCKSSSGQTLSGPVTERNCVAARRGGEQQEVNDRSIGMTNSIRPGVVGESARGKAKPLPE
jgi:hypothetical protein